VKVYVLILVLLLVLSIKFFITARIWIQFRLLSTTHKIPSVLRTRRLNTMRVYKT